MGIFNITEFEALGHYGSNIRDPQLPEFPADASQNVTTSATSAQSSTLGASTDHVRIVADVDVYYKVGTAPTAAPGDTFLPVGVVDYIRIRGTSQKIAVIDK